MGAVVDKVTAFVSCLIRMALSDHGQVSSYQLYTLPGMSWLKQAGWIAIEESANGDSTTDATHDKRQ